MKLRVGFDARWYNDSGVGTYVAELLRAMAPMQSASNVELVVYESEPRHTKNGVAPGAASGAATDGIKVPGIERVILGSPKYSVAEQFELARRCRLDHLSILHCPFYVMPFVASCPVVITIHDLIPFLFPIYSSAKGVIIRTAYRVAARRAAHIITVSRNTAHDVQRLLHVTAGKITAVPNAANAMFTPSAANADEERSMLRDRFGIAGPYVMAASARNWKHKNLESALFAVESALQSVPALSVAGFQTMVYGPSEGLAAAGGAARWRSIHLHHTGFTSSQDLAVLFRHARAFVMPSLYEGFGLPILEAMSCGCPVITSTGGSLPEVAGEGAQIFAPDDIAGMGSAIAALVTSDDNYARWRAAALKRAASFSWQRTAYAVLNVYQKVCDARAH